MRRLNSSYRYTDFSIGNLKPMLKSAALNLRLRNTLCKSAQYAPRRYSDDDDKSLLDRIKPWAIGLGGVALGTQIADIYNKKAHEHGWQSGPISGIAQMLAGLIKGQKPAESIR